MTTAAAEVGLERPYTYDELAEADPAVGGVAFAPDSGTPCIVLWESDTPAGDHPVAFGGVLTDWMDCAPEETVYLVVGTATLRSKPEDWRGVDHVRQAVNEGRVLDRAVPSSKIAPLPREWADEVRR